MKLIVRAFLVLGVSFLFSAHVWADLKELSIDEYRVKGYAAMQSQDYLEALKNYNKAVSLGADNPALYNDLGILYEKAGNAPKAEEYYLESIKVGPKYLPAYMNLALLYKQTGNILKAVHYLKQRYALSGREDSWAKKAKEALLVLDPSQDMWVRQVQARWLEQEMATPPVPAIPKEYQGKTAKDLSLIALKFYNDKQYDRAVQVFDYTLILEPANLNYKTARDEAYAQWQKLLVPDALQPGIRDLDSETKAVIFRQTDEHVLKAIEHYFKGKDALAQGNLESARSELDASLQLVPANPAVMEDRKKVEFALAQNTVKQAADLASKKIQEGDYASAKAQLKQAMKNIPNKDFIDTSKAAKIHPSWNEADYQEFENRIKFNQEHFDNGKAAMDAGDFKKAANEFKWAIKLIPSDSKSAQLLKQAEESQANKTVQTYSGEAIKKLESGDPDSAKKELEDLLTTLSDTKK
ncbi:MAG: tetratricopeptide repeat protein [Candidatus Omnitrophica bacterium]|nr:tetratricopeptide repeat protein [Candidatus Omnitrophota bacterium]